MGLIGKMKTLAKLRHYSGPLRGAAYRTLSARRALRNELKNQPEWQEQIRRGRWSQQYTAKYAAYWWNAFKDRRAEVREYLELGSWEGQSLVLAAWLFPNATLTSVDWFNNPKAVRNLEYNTTPFKDRLTKIKGTSHEVLIELAREGRTYDVIYIDADHRFDAVLLDTILSWSLVNVGGYLIWDDYLWTEPSVKPLYPKPAIDAWFKTRSGFCEVLFAHKQVCVRKTKADPALLDMGLTLSVREG
jgi:predicted O-methyltransferase YrrM